MSKNLVLVLINIINMYNIFGIIKKYFTNHGAKQKDYRYRPYFHKKHMKLNKKKVFSWASFSDDQSLMLKIGVDRLQKAILT